MKCGGNVRSGHLHLLPLNGREHGARLIAIPVKVCIELDNQPCVGRGGDGFEQLLQPTALELLDCPLGGFKNFEVAIDVKLRLKNNLPLLKSWMGGLGTGA
jgi:hypothetical protein